MAKIITTKRLETFWAKAVSKLTEGVNGKKLSSNDFTDELKEKYDKAEPNTIKTISLNGKNQAIDENRNLDIQFDAGTGIKEVTQEQYDTLSDEEKMSNIIYHIIDAKDDKIILNLMIGETSTTAYAGDKGKALKKALIELSDAVYDNGSENTELSKLYAEEIIANERTYMSVPLNLKTNVADVLKELGYSDLITE